jgi:ParB family chromosome partitioning protein
VAPPPPPQDTAAPLNAVIQVKTDRIARSPWQPRVSFDEEALRELSESIKVHGVIQPLVCRRLPAEKGGGYELIAGERRLRAAIDAGLTEVPVVLSNSDDKASAEMTIIENIQRQDLNVIEEAVGYKTLAEEFGLTQQDVADRVGKARPSVANSLRLLELPDEVKMLLSSGLLSTGHAKVLLSLTDETEQTLLGRRCVEEQLTVRALERLIARRTVEKNAAENKKQDIPESHVRYLLEKLHGKFGAPVRLQPSVTFANGRRAKGSIEIDFADNDDLTRLLEIFGIDVD